MPYGFGRMAFLIYKDLQASLRRCDRSLVNFRSLRVAAIDSNSCSQVSKSRRWMPWHLEPKKDVVICDKPRGADKRALIRGSPNGETPLGAAMRPGDSRLNI